MKHLLIAQTNITNPSWVQEYLNKVTSLLSIYSGKYMTRTSSIELLEGREKPQYLLIAEFATKESALAFYDSEEYAPLKTARQKGASSKFLLVQVENSST